MNNMPFPYPQAYGPFYQHPYQPPYPQTYQPQPTLNIEEEIKKLKQDVKALQERIDRIEHKNHKNYLQKEEGKYMM